MAPLPGVARTAPGDVEMGMASWYGHPYHGRPAADGEIYNMEMLVAAHRTLPFDTWVRVVNLDNQKSVEVRIIDRGPFVENRIIDLSHAAARAIDLIGPGTAPVRVEVVRTPANAEPALFAVQVAAFRNRANAERLAPRWRRGTDRPGWCCAPGIRICGASWWGRRRPRMGPARFPSASSGNQVREVPSWCD